MSHLYPGLVFALLAAGCATPYSYRFDLLNAAPADEVSAVVRVDPDAAAVSYELTNQTDQVVQVHWAQVALHHPDGTTSSLRPDGDLGWILPGAKQAVWLGPLVLPVTGASAAAYDGQLLELEVPMTVRQELRVYRYHFAVHAEPLRSSR